MSKRVVSKRANQVVDGRGTDRGAETSADSQAETISEAGSGICQRGDEAGKKSARFRDGFWASFYRTRQAIWRKHRGGFKFWLSIVTFILIVIILYAARNDLHKAFDLLSGVNIWILLLIIPVQFFSYYASTEIFFTYLRARGQLKDVSPLHSTSIALEFNFVNHVFPSAGVSGASYMVWRLGKLGVSAGQAAMSQLINYIVLGGTFVIMMIIALIWATLEDRAANWLVVAVAIATTALAAVIIFGSYIINSREWLMNFAGWLTTRTNWLVKKITFGRKTNVLAKDALPRFFADFYDDFTAIKKNKVLLKQPIIWGFLSNIADVLLFAITFWALGDAVNLAILLLSFGAAAVGSFVVVTPGGVGAYEVVMISVLVAGGTSPEMASAGVILSRVILVVGTIVCGVFAYQHALSKYGQPVMKPLDEMRPTNE